MSYFVLQQWNFMIRQAKIIVPDEARFQQKSSEMCYIS